MRIAVVGTGYVGLVAGVCFADSGHTVACVDIDEAKIKALNQGRSPIYEPGLEELLEKNLAAERITFTTELNEAVRGSDVVFIAVGTPERDDGSADLRAAMSVAHQIAEVAERYTVVVNKSTVPVGTAARMQAEIATRARVEVDVVSNPEFLKEGAAIDDFLRPDRIVIGSPSERARGIMAELYAPFVRTEGPMYFMDPRSAELTKYAANAMLASRISFINDVAMTSSPMATPKRLDFTPLTATGGTQLTSRNSPCCPARNRRGRTSTLCRLVLSGPWPGWQAVGVRTSAPASGTYAPSMPSRMPATG